MRILILAHDFPPLNTIGARRPYSWFRYFPAANVYPIVITKSWERDASSSITSIASQKGSESTITEETESHTLIRVPIKKSLPDHMLIRFGEQRFRFIRRMLSLFNLMFSYPFFSFDKNREIYQAADQFLKKNSADAIIATGEPFILFKYAHRLSRKHKIPWVADYRDGWYLNHISAQRNGLLGTLLWQWEYLFEKKYLSSCRLVTSVDPLLTSRLQNLHGVNGVTIYNGFEEWSPLQPQAAVTESPLSLVYSGTLYPGHQVEVLLQSVLELDESGLLSPHDLRIKFLGLEFYGDQLKRVRNYHWRLAEYIETTPRLTRAEAGLQMTQADFLLIFTDKWTPVLPSKMYESVAKRRPLMVILNDHSLLESVINELGAGLLINSKDELKKVILEKINAKKNNQPLFDSVLDEVKAQTYSRHEQALRLAHTLIREFGPRPSGGKTADEAAGV